MPVITGRSEEQPSIPCRTSAGNWASRSSCASPAPEAPSAHCPPRPLGKEPIASRARGRRESTRPRRKSTSSSTKGAWLVNAQEQQLVLRAEPPSPAALEFPFHQVIPACSRIPRKTKPALCQPPVDLHKDAAGRLRESLFTVMAQEQGPLSADNVLPWFVPLAHQEALHASRSSMRTNRSRSPNSRNPISP